MAALAHPTNASQSICINNQQQRRYHKYSNFHDDEDMLAVLSDEIWFHAGDTSVDVCYHCADERTIILIFNFFLSSTGIPSVQCWLASIPLQVFFI